MLQPDNVLFQAITQGNDEDTENAVKEIASLGHGCLPAISELLHSNEVDHRWWGVRTLAQLVDPPQELLIESLEDKAEEVRQCALLAICHHPLKTALQPVMKLMHAKDGMTANLAASALIAIGKDSIPDLLNELPGLNGYNRVEAFRTIANLEDQACIPILMKGLEEESIMVNYWSEEGLTRLGLDMVYMKPE